MRKSNKLAITSYDQSPMVLPHSTLAENDDLVASHRQLSEHITDAVNAGVREIHFEQDAGICRIRKRDNGQLDESRIDSNSLAADLIAEICDFTKSSNEPLYGEVSFSQRFAIGLCTLECSYYPTTSGQNLSIIIGSSNQIPESLDQTELDKKQIQSLRHLYSKNNTGITLMISADIGLLQPLYYGLLGELNCVEKKIVSVEYKNAKNLARINQVLLVNQPNPEQITRLASQYADTLFIDWHCSKKPAVMRNLFAQYRSATVFLTADSCSQAIAQLTDSAANAKQLATNLRNIVQVKNTRLVCPHCANAYQLNGEDMQWLEKHSLAKQKEQAYMYAAGCERCSFSGSVNSQPLLSSYTLDDNMRSAIESRSTAAISTSSERIQESQSINKQLLKLVAQGKVSFEEYKNSHDSEQ